MADKWQVMVTNLTGGTITHEAKGAPETIMREIMKNGFWQYKPMAFVPAAAVALIEFGPTS